MRAVGLVGLDDVVVLEAAIEGRQLGVAPDDVHEGRRPVIARGHAFRQRGDVVPDAEHTPDAVSRAVHVRRLSGEDGGDGGERPRRLCPGVVVALALRGEGVEVRRRLARVAVGGKVVGAHRVEDHEHHVRLRRSPVTAGLEHRAHREQAADASSEPETGACGSRDRRHESPRPGASSREGVHSEPAPGASCHACSREDLECGSSYREARAWRAAHRARPIAYRTPAPARVRAGLHSPRFPCRAG